MWRFWENVVKRKLKKRLLKIYAKLVELVEKIE